MAEGLSGVNGTGLRGNGERRRKTSEDLARQIAAYIVENGLSEGAMLPKESTMQQMVDVGRNTLREALRLLEAHGVIWIKAGPEGGPVVRLPRADELRGPLALQLQMHQGSLKALVEARIALEPSVAAMAAARISKDDLQLLQRNIGDMRDTLPASNRLFLLRNDEFHQIVARSSQNLIMESFTSSVMSIFTSARSGISYNARRQEQVICAHEEIFEALSAHDATAAEKAMRDHMEAGMRYYMRKHPDLMNQPIRWL